MPKRFQISRKAGWRKPPSGIIVARPSKWGNPFPIDETHNRDQSIANFERYLAELNPAEREQLLEPLRGKDLGCWCKLSDKCHADVLLRWANRS